MSHNVISPSSHLCFGKGIFGLTIERHYLKPLDRGVVIKPFAQVKANCTSFGRSDILDSMKRQHTNIYNSCNVIAFVFGTYGMCRIGKYHYSSELLLHTAFCNKHRLDMLTFDNVANFVIIARNTSQIYRNNGFGFWCDCLFYLVGIYREIVVYIDHYRRCTCIHNSHCCCTISICRNYDFIAGLDTQPFQNQCCSACPRVYTYCTLYSQSVAQSLFQSLDFRSWCYPTASQCLLYWFYNILINVRRSKCYLHFLSYV